MCVNSNIFLNRILGREKKLSKVLECALPFHTLKASILNPGIIFCVFDDMFITSPHFGETCYFMWYDHMHGCMLLISMLLEMNTLVMIIILMCLACIPVGTGKTSALGRHEFVAGHRRDGYVRYGMVRYNECWLYWLKYIRYTNHAGNT